MSEVVDPKLDEKTTTWDVVFEVTGFFPDYPSDGGGISWKIPNPGSWCECGLSTPKCPVV